MKTSDLIFKTKEELIEDALNTKTFKVIKYGAIAISGIYLCGYIFKILAFTNYNYRSFKNSFHYQK